MALRIRTPNGPEPMPELPAVLKGRKFSIEGDAVMCPFCLMYNTPAPRKSGPQKCKHCEQTFILLIRGPRTYLTSKQEIATDE